ncbi:hypothetical protein E2C00_01885 [Streptomyces sp. WAC05374]|uniref:DUF6256 family protein n=1 Tax=Streptomyces sp. WAC05374 TaxID=2487420 RepID=UPI000F89CA49|nr:DUF6256 family protein [Streptomyces sp. WAC05374]RST00411.1 hypothetical protein EF905_35700 [Streptomyces sp. WAC05374]TDF50284.1 hypothetical protein E2B92_01860 [Streptomyces sp. WAC05374]TDF58008.1 hypothetical protein E2C02_09650 [Streptomyces sp. WAC05374]TDF60536.1 hypothetical protein E2C00_01885 [Streptomyces sp. WAC05374]
MLPVSLDITLMLAGYLAVMAYLGLGLLILGRRPAARRWVPARRLLPVSAKHGMRAFVRQVLGTAIGGYVLLMLVVVGYYQGVAHLGGAFLASAVTGAATLIGISVPLFLLASWFATRRRG